MAKGTTILADQRRNEQKQSLINLSDRDLCEMIRAHFESHPALPGEKIMKDQVNQMLSQFDITEEQKTVDNNIMTAEEKETLVQQYANTRIRETHLKEGNYYFDFRHFDPTELKQEQITETADVAGNPVFVSKVNVELQNNGAGEVYVLAEQSDGSHRTVGSLPDNFLKNNPMLVDHCDAELQIADFSNGHMKNLSVTLVADTDLMSGDVIDLDDDLLKGLDQTAGMAQ